jgi:hypothetical protein
MNLIPKSITHRRGPTLFCGQRLRRNYRVVVRVPAMFSKFPGQVR